MNARKAELVSGYVCEMGSVCNRISPCLSSSCQRNFSMSVNSAVVLRLTGRGGGTVVGAPRGRSSSRGRGELLVGRPAVQLIQVKTSN